MSHYQESYKGSNIEIENEKHLTIDAKTIDCEHDQETRKWSSRYLPYTRYDSLIDLAQAIVRDTDEFMQTH